MARGSIALVLHAHLPFVRHPEHDEVPRGALALRGHHRDLPAAARRPGGAGSATACDVRLTLSLSPTLLRHAHATRCCGRATVVHLDGLVRAERGEEIAARTRSSRWHRCAELYLAPAHRDARSLLLDHWRQDVAGAFRAFQERGRVELVTTAATHAVLPLAGDHRRHASARRSRSACARVSALLRPCVPRGSGSPSAPSTPASTTSLPAADVALVRRRHARPDRTPRPQPVLRRRTRRSSRPRAWPPSAATPTAPRRSGARRPAIPADPWYRDFYRDIGFDLPARPCTPFVPDEPAQPDRPQVPSHHRRHRRTRTPYDPRASRRSGWRRTPRTSSRRAARRSTGCAASMDRPPVIVCPYDAELFGHWWYEGVDWLEAVLRRLAATPDLDATTLSARSRSPARAAARDARRQHVGSAGTPCRLAAAPRTSGSIPTSTPPRSACARLCRDVTALRSVSSRRTLPRPCASCSSPRRATGPS